MLRSITMAAHAIATAVTPIVIAGQLCRRASLPNMQLEFYPLGGRRIIANVSSDGADWSGALLQHGPPRLHDRSTDSPHIEERLLTKSVRRLTPSAHTGPAHANQNPPSDGHV
jgi:hypothetical protein